MCAHQLPCVGDREGLAGHEGLMSTTEADLALSLLYVIKGLFHLALHCVAFSLATHTEMRWTEVF